MKKIYKYQISEDSPTVYLPEGAVILTIQVQLGEPFLWALVDVKNDTRKRKIVTVPTGISFDPTGFDYIGTFQLPSGLVFHTFIEP